MLTLNSTFRRSSPALTLAVLLGSAVFLWGLGYKLSLYQPATAHHSKPAVRLLSQKERPAPILHLDRLFRSGNAPRHPIPQPSSTTDLARLDPFHLVVAGASGPLSRPSTPFSQQPQRMAGSSPRAPPIGS